MKGFFDAVSRCDEEGLRKAVLNARERLSDRGEILPLFSCYTPRIYDIVFLFRQDIISKGIKGLEDVNDLINHLFGSTEEFSNEQLKLILQEADQPISAVLAALDENQQINERLSIIRRITRSASDYLDYLPGLFSENMPSLTDEEASVLPIDKLLSVAKSDVNFESNVLPRICSRYTAVPYSKESSELLFYFLENATFPSQLSESWAKAYLKVFEWANEVNHNLEQRMVPFLEKELSSGSLEFNKHLFDVYDLSGQKLSEDAKFLIESGAYKCVSSKISLGLLSYGSEWGLKFFFLSAVYNGTSFGFSKKERRKDFHDLAKEIFRDYAEEFYSIRENLLKECRRNLFFREFPDLFNGEELPLITSEEMDLLHSIKYLSKIPPTFALVSRVMRKNSAQDVLEFLEEIKYPSEFSNSDQEKLATLASSSSCCHLWGKEGIYNLFHSSAITSARKMVLTKKWKNE